MSKRRAAMQATTVLAALGGIVTIAMQVDRYLIERRQMVAQMRFEEAVRDCVETGGKWFKGECRYATD